MEMWWRQTGWQDDLIYYTASHQSRSPPHFIYDAKWLLRQADCGGGLFLSNILFAVVNILCHEAEGGRKILSQAVLMKSQMSSSYFFFKSELQEIPLEGWLSLSEASSDLKTSSSSERQP